MLDQVKIDALRDLTVPAQSLLIDGKHVPAQDGRTLTRKSPINGQALTTFANAGAVDVDLAVASARAAFEDGRWSGMAPVARKRIMHKWANLIEAEALALTVLGVRDNGTEINMAIKAEAFGCAATIRFYAETCDKTYGEIAPTDPAFLGLIHHEAVGVVGAIIPWNFPLMIGAWKMAPAMSVGNSVILKPSETASLSLLRVAALALEAGVPPGVLNVVTGDGAVAGEALALSMDVDVLAFTGSGATGRKLLEYAARSNLKRIYLELGGKSPNVVFADAPDLDQAAKVAAGGIFRNAGQVCVAGSRLLVEASIHDEFVAAVAKHTAAITTGNPLDLTTQSGAINNDRQLAQNLDFVSKASAEGGQVVTGGTRILAETGGSYMASTIVTGVTRHAHLFQQEAFGPILAVTPFKDEAEAVSLANATDLALASGVWTSDLSRGHRMIRALRAGVVHVNTYGGPDVTVPLSGVGQSGNGADKSMHALDKYRNLKTGWIAL